MKSHASKGFSIIELLVAVAISSVLVVLLLTFIERSTKTLDISRSRVNAFQDARQLFESLTRKLSQATLNTTFNYYDSSNKPLSASNIGTFQPTYYGRFSDLHFVSGQSKLLLPSTLTQTGAVFYQAPLGYSNIRLEDPAAANSLALKSSMNAKGFFLEYRNINAQAPTFVTGLPERWRFCLMEMVQPTEEFSVYDAIVKFPGEPYRWFRKCVDGTTGDSEAYKGILAENVIALVLLPQRSGDPQASSTLAEPDYLYDTRAFDSNPSGASNSARLSHNQLPPTIEIIMVIIDEASAIKLDERYHGDTSHLPFIPDLFKSLGVGATESAQQAAVQADLAELESRLRSEKVSYRVFSTQVSIRQAKWSEDL